MRTVQKQEATFRHMYPSLLDIDPEADSIVAEATKAMARACATTMEVFLCRLLLKGGKQRTHAAKCKGEFTMPAKADANEWLHEDVKNLCDELPE